jgi:ParB family transcriptional regulator, chromosome partitioning protein
VEEDVMARKNLLADLIDSKLTAVNEPTKAAAPELPSFSGRGAVGAMSRSLEQMSAEVEAARSITEAVAAGEAVVEIPPDRIDESFVVDRFDHEGSVDDLVASIREHGQQVPILVRPHPSARGRFQTAYGHRRLKAIRQLGISARCVVRQLDDNALVVAQGQENSARRDLSFIERASFAVALEDRSFGRDTIMAALSVDKTELSRMVSTRRALPDEIVRAIGAAPLVGRRRWMELAERLKQKKAVSRALEAAKSETLAGLTSDQRFAAVMEALSLPPPATKSLEWRDKNGRRIASVRDTPNIFQLAIDVKAAPDFGHFVLDELPSLYEAYLARRASSNPE